MERRIIQGAGWCAVTESGKLMEYISGDDFGQSGVILAGKVERMMKSLNCAFVDIGRKKNGFLPLQETGGSFTGGAVHSGETLLLQVKKEETGDKGAFLTRDITLPGRLVIIMPMNRYIGVSGRVTDESVRERLKLAGKQIAGGRFGLVMRSAAEKSDETDLRNEAETIFTQWQILEQRAKSSGKPGTVYYQIDPLERLKEDYAGEDFELVVAGEKPSPDILRQIHESHERTICLKNGGNIVIDRCEAMTVIDVNTASSAGCVSKEQTVKETNLEACESIAQQVRLRDLNGIILIDFIDMDTERDRNLVSDRLYECFRADRIKTVIHGWTKLGLLEMTRKRK